MRAVKFFGCRIKSSPVFWTVLVLTICFISFNYSNLTNKRTTNLLVISKLSLSETFQKDKLQSINNLTEKHISKSINNIADSFKDQPNFRELLGVQYNKFVGNLSNDNLANRDKYLIYRCDTTKMTHCGGWGDMIKGFMAGYIFANLTGRTFKIEMKPHGCNILDYLVPNQVNWSLPHSFHKEIVQSEDVQIFNVIGNLSFYRSISTINFRGNNLIKSKFVYFKSNSDYTFGLKANKFHAKELSWMAHLSREQVVSNTFRWLFKLSPALQKRVDDLLRKAFSSSSEKLVCAHIRMGRNPSIPNDSEIRNVPAVLPKVWNFINNSLSQHKGSKVFIMSDSLDTIKEAKKQSFSDRIILVPGGIVHMERSANVKDEDICKMQEKVVMEQFMLMHCDVLMISRSNLNRLPTYVRGSSVGLFCLKSGEIKPCKISNV